MLERGTDGLYHPVIMDFGLARDTNESSGMTESGAVMGTAAFMSPEQARGQAKRLDRRSDVYSLGATLFDLLAGRPPFVSESMADTLLKVMLEDPPHLRDHAPGIPEALDIIVGKTLNKDPAQRYASAKDLAEDLQRFLGNRRIVGKRLPLLYRMRYRAERNKPLVILGAALLATLMVLVVYGIRTRIQTLRKERQAKQQTEIAQRLGQEITNMDWLLRSARQIPLHDLGREKTIMRKRMAQLQLELASYGELSRGLGHYALGRGHMALHEYPDALRELQSAINYDNQRAEVHYALGFVLGKHYEQAMRDARLAGGGDWAKKKLKEIEPLYLLPAISSLQRARAMKLDAPQYLEGLIAYYKGEYDVALKNAQAALSDAPWLYEASQLIGDVHMQRGITALDNANAEVADKELSAAVAGYQEAVRIGQSDAEAYEALAEAYNKLTELSAQKQKLDVKVHEAALATCDKLNIADPQSIAGPLKKARGIWLAMAMSDPTTERPPLIKKCLTNVEIALKIQPENPYANEILSSCLSDDAVRAYNQHQDPGPSHRRAIAVLEPILQKYPQFLLGHRNMGIRYQDLAVWVQRGGDPNARALFEKSLEYFAQTLALDASDAEAVGLTLDSLGKLIAMARSKAERETLIAKADAAVEQCHKLIGDHFSCEGNRILTHAAAAERAFVNGDDPQPDIQRVEQSKKELQKQKLEVAEIEHGVVLARYIDALARSRREQDAQPAIEQLREAVDGCLKLAPTDYLCLLYSAQTAWLESELPDVKAKAAASALKKALESAERGIKQTVKYPRAWQVLAETNLRLARTAKKKVRDKYLRDASEALDKAFAMNPDLAVGRVTEAELQILRADKERDDDKRVEAGKAAQRALEHAQRSDPLLAHDVAPLLKQAKELVTGG